MSDETELSGENLEQIVPGVETSSALDLVLRNASRTAADTFLEEQTALLHTQREHLHEQRALQISHLKWRRFNDWTRAGWQLMLGALGAVVVAAIAAALWNASQADGLVVDAFTVPLKFAQQGLSGDVVADDVVERLGAVRRTAMSDSYSISNGVAADRANDVKVDIPETGISVSDAWRYLRRWLGHERHLTGSLRDLGDGRVALSLSLDGGSTIAEVGRLSDLAAMERIAAEAVFGAFDPVNYVQYLTTQRRRREAMEAAARLVPVSQGVAQADAYCLWAYTSVYATGDVALGLARVHLATEIYFPLAVAHVMAARFDSYLGHDEERLSEDHVVVALSRGDQPPAHRHGGFEAMQQHAAAQIALLEGDFANASHWGCNHFCNQAALLVTQAILSARIHDIVLARKQLGEGLAAGTPASTDISEARFEIDSEEANWRAAASDAEGISEFPKDGSFSPRLIALTHATYATPLLALAQAHLGNFAVAEKMIGSSPRDCVACTTARGNIEAMQRHWSAAAAWFAAAVKQAPSTPFADADWGAMLLHKGDCDGAIAKFAAAHAKGPHFADPLEMWGEALMQKNRSDLALAKFEEADKNAPNWGRLHLEWGKALLWSGDRAGAEKQFEIASRLNLRATDAAALKNMSDRHV